MAQVERILFSEGREARLLRVRRDEPIPAILERLALPAAKAVICLNGGTAELTEPLISQLKSLLTEGVARFAAEESITLITGGTDAGIFALLGAGLSRWPSAAACLGVVPEQCVRWPGHAGGETPLEPHHTHFLAVQGSEWGDETDTMTGVLNTLGATCPTAVIVAGGGAVTLREMRAHTEARRPMILLAGSGRNTDAVLAARAGGKASDEKVRMIAERGLISSFPVNENSAALRDLIRRTISPAAHC